MYRKLTSLRWHTYLPADAGETFTSTLDLFFAGPFLFAKPELAKHKNSRKTLLLICSLYGRQWKYPKIYHMRSIFLCLGNSIVKS